MKRRLPKLGDILTWQDDQCGFFVVGVVIGVATKHVDVAKLHLMLVNKKRLDLWKIEMEHISKDEIRSQDWSINFVNDGVWQTLLRGLKPG